MAYKTYKGKRRRALLFGAPAFILVLFAGAAILKQNNYVKELKEVYEVKTNELETLKAKQGKFAYVTNQDIKAGERINSTKVSYDSIYSSMEESLFASIGEEYKIALVDIPSGTQILNSMVSEEEIDPAVREEEFNVFYLSKNLAQIDAVDIRIFYPNGENYIVLSKKIVKGLNLETANCRLWLDEQETLLISSAIVDAYLIPGTYLYTTKYVETSIQEASIVTYTPSKEAIDLIANSPNILEQARISLRKEVREDIENRTASFVKKEGEKKAIEAFPKFVNQGSVVQEESEEAIKEEVKEDEEIIYVD